MPKISIGNARVIYEFEIHGKYSLICDNSGTGKTTLCEFVQLSLRHNSGVTNKSDIQLRVLPDNYDELKPEAFNGRVVFIDESSNLLHTNGYEKWLQSLDCYFVIISRDMKFGNLPISINSVYIMHNSGKYNTLRLIDKSLLQKPIVDLDVVVAEDSNSGFQFIKEVVRFAGNTSLKCVSSDGNANIVKCLEKLSKLGYKNFCIIFDAAAFGIYLRDLNEYIMSHSEYNYFVIDWESFENYILASPVFGLNYTLADVGCHYESLEQFSTSKLKEVLHNSAYYNKSNLIHCFHIDACKKCKNKNFCNFVYYNYDSLIYAKVRTLYNFILKSRNLQQSSVDLTYSTFLDSAVSLRRMKRVVVYNISSINKKQDICILSDDLSRKQSMFIKDVVCAVMNKRYTLHNPSMLKDWRGFKK